MNRLISMEDAIRAIEDEWDGCCSEYPATQIIYDTTEAIEKLPIIQPEPHWIPVTDGLPNIREDVLVSYYDEVMVGWLNDDGTWFVEGFGRLNMNEIVAWMLLPEPYKGATT